MTPVEIIDDIAIEQGSANPYADLGRPDADEMLVKAELAHQIAQIIKSRHLTQQRAAELLGMPQPKLSEMLRGKFRGISQAKMMECLNRLGRDVEIVVKKASRRSLGHTHVVLA
ncbi:helix-turn-helix transcriptional regulator [Chitinivorax sp. B]|uniref:helix-turn-helix domain-containing protein n=1 Tax=Chitinivorax sp. B TaxID=2502235 RepID=UPI0010F8F549|nr:helix-turn-helix transcriptional regulator [Chitinivorax sp. B]